MRSLPGAGVEPARLSPRDFKSLVFTDFTIPAGNVDIVCASVSLLPSSSLCHGEKKLRERLRGVNGTDVTECV